MKRPASNYPPALRERAVGRVAEVSTHHPSQWAAIEAVSGEFGIGSPETLRRWVRRAEIDAGGRSDTGTETEEVGRLRREVTELRRANAILEATSNFFAAELDRPRRSS